MSKKRKPVGAKNDKRTTYGQTTFDVGSITHPCPFGQEVSFADYEKAAGGVKPLVEIGREVCPKFDKSNYSKAKKPDETGLTLHKPIIKAWQKALPEISPRKPRSHDCKTRPHKVTIRLDNELYSLLQQARWHNGVKLSLTETAICCLWFGVKEFEREGTPSSYAAIDAENLVLRTYVRQLEQQLKKERGEDEDI